MRIELNQIDNGWTANYTGPGPRFIDGTIFADSAEAALAAAMKAMLDKAMAN